ncbi:transposase (plasmid) [Mesorhizobium sp. AR02]|nr:transposase [Mesorhizobium sp. AR02]
MCGFHAFLHIPATSRLVKRQKNDAADAEAIVEAAQRPTMRFVEPKTEEQQSRSIMFRTREQLVNQRTELVNALRAHL